MARKKGGLGTQTKEKPEDLLDAVFGDAEQKPEKEKPKPKRINKYMQLDRGLVRQLKVYAAENDMKEYEVMESALRQFFGNESD